MLGFHFQGTFPPHLRNARVPYYHWLPFIERYPFDAEDFSIWRFQIESFNDHCIIEFETNLIVDCSVFNYRPSSMKFFDEVLRPSSRNLSTANNVHMNTMVFTIWCYLRTSPINASLFPFHRFQGSPVHWSPTSSCRAICTLGKKF